MSANLSKKRVVVGVSGGVDSSVSLLLLKRAGFSPVGVFINLWNENPEKNKETVVRAEKICKILDVPFHVLDAKGEFKKKVVDYFVQEYEKGNTPNPCTVCNKEIKINLLLQSLSSFDAEYIATGHYARIKKNEEYFISKGADKKKDQSYFLWDIKKEWLPRIIFPLGEIKKEEVYKIATEKNLPVTDQKESQEVCFIEDSSSEFLGRYLEPFSGDIKNKKGEVIGQHNGLFNYTIGQRKKIGLSGGPYYVLSKNTERNELVVTDNEDNLLREELFYSGANFFTDLPFPFEALVKIRYNTKEARGVVYKNKVIFSSPQKSVTPGQSVVFYKEDKLIGGGVIN